MTQEEIADWVARQWLQQAESNTPLARSIRSAKAGNRVIKREYLKEKRALASRSAAKSRSIRKRQIESEMALRKRETAREEEMAEKRLALIMAQW